MKQFNFFRNNTLRTTSYWKDSVEYTIQIPEDIDGDFEISWYLRGWMDAHHNYAKSHSERFLNRRNYVVYRLGYHNYQLTQQELTYKKFYENI